MLERDGFVAMVDDADLARAVDRAAKSLPSFIKAFVQRGRASTDFYVVVAERQGARVIPFGILVHEIDGEHIKGAKTANDSQCTPGAIIVCECKHIIDWRYVDCFELQGGEVFKHLLDRCRPAIKRDIIDEATFFIERPSEIPEEDYKLLRQVVNGPADKAADVIGGRNLDVDAPLLVPMIRDEALELVEASLLEFACMYSTVPVLHRLAQFSEGRKLDRIGLLHDAALAGNSETTRYLAGRIGNIDTSDDQGRTALHFAARSGDVATAEALLRASAAIDPKDVDGMSPLFHARTAEMTRLLLERGASLRTTDDNGQNPLEYHRSHGRMDIVAIIADGKPNPAAHRNTVLAAGEQELKNAISSGAIVDSSGLAEALDRDFGAILPVRAFSIRAAGR